MHVLKSRFTIGATADEVHLERGERVTYVHDDGRELEVTIDSNHVSHAKCPNLGYEVKQDCGHRFFADGKRLKFDPHYWLDPIV